MTFSHSLVVSFRPFMRRKTGYIRAHGNGWEIAYYDINHVRQFERFASEEEAHAQLAQRLAEVANGIPVSSRPNTVKFGELCADVVTDYRINNRASIDDIECRFRRHIIPIFGERKASQITTAQLRAYTDRRLTQGAKPGTVQHELEAIKHAFKMAAKDRKILSMPHIPMLNPKNTREGFFTREEVERLCSHLKKPLDSFVMFAFLTGWRYGEIQRLQWRNVDFQAGEIRLNPGTTKSGDGRVFPITAELHGLLAPLSTKRAPKELAVIPGRVVAEKRAATLTPHVFQIDGKPIGAFRKSWRTACIKSGFCIRDVKGNVIKITRIFHDLRRSAVRQWILSGMPEKIAMLLSGHKTRSVLDRYAIINAADLLEAGRYLQPAVSSSSIAPSASRGNGRDSSSND